MACAVRSATRIVLQFGVALSLLFLVVVGLGPLTGRYRVVTVLSGSMRPSLPVQSVAISTPERLDQVRVGQIITFEMPIAKHQVVTHRVIEVVASGDHLLVRTQGDANPVPDPWVAKLQDGPVWKVRTVLPGLGSAILILRSSSIRVVTVLVAPLLLALSAIRTSWNPRPVRPRRRAQAPVGASA